MATEFRGKWTPADQKIVSSTTPPGQWRFTAKFGKFSACRDGWTEEGMISNTPEELAGKLEIYNQRSR